MGTRVRATPCQAGRVDGRLHGNGQRLPSAGVGGGEAAGRREDVPRRDEDAAARVGRSCACCADVERDGGL